MRPVRIYVFGSYARGDAQEHSEIDLLLVVQDTAQPPHLLAGKAYELADERSIAMDVIVMPEDEFWRRSKAQASLPATVLREGKLL